MTDQPEKEAAPLSDEEIETLRSSDVIATLSTKAPYLAEIAERILVTIDRLRAKVAELEAGVPDETIGDVAYLVGRRLVRIGVLGDDWADGSQTQRTCDIIAETIREEIVRRKAGR